MQASSCGQVGAGEGDLAPKLSRVHACLPNCLRERWGSPPRSTNLIFYLIFDLIFDHAEHLGYPTRAKLRQKCSDERTQQLYGRPKITLPPVRLRGGGAMQQDAAIRCAQRRPRVSYTSAATPPLRTLSANWGLRVGSRMLPSSAHCVAEAIEKRGHRFKVSWYLCGSSGRSKLLQPSGPRVSLPWFRHRRPKASRTAGASCGASSRLF